MSESRLAKVIVIFIVAFVAFGFSSVAGFSTGGLFGIDLFNLNNDSGDTNSSNPFSFEVSNNSNYDSASSNNYQTTNDQSDSNSNSNNGNSSDNNNNNNNNQNNNNNNGNDNGDGGADSGQEESG